MYFPKISNVNGMTERRIIITSSSFCSGGIRPFVKTKFNQRMNSPIGGIKDLDCNTKSNLLNIEIPISGLGKPKLYQNLVLITMCGDFT